MELRSAAASRYIAESAASTIYELRSQRSGSQQTHRGKGPKIGLVAEEIGPPIRLIVRVLTLLSSIYKKRSNTCIE